MVTVLTGAAGSHGMPPPGVSREPMGVVDRSAWPDSTSSEAVRLVVRGEPGVGKTALAARFAVGLQGQRLGRANRNRLQHAADRTHAALRALDEAVAADSSLVLLLDPVGGRPAGQPDAVLGDLLIQCKSSRDFPAADPSERGAHVVSALLKRNVEPGAPWQALPNYTDRPFVARSCCGASAVTREAMVAARMPKLPEPRALSDITHRLWLVHEQWREVAAVPLMVTIRDKELARDYRQGLRSLVAGVLDLILVMVMAVLSQLVQVPSFLLVVLAAIRHYGLRSESDWHVPLTLRMHLMTARGTACPAA